MRWRSAGPSGWLRQRGSQEARDERWFIALLVIVGVTGLMLSVGLSGFSGLSH